MTLELHPEFRLQKLRIGREQAPLLVVDNLVANPADLVELAAGKLFADVASYYPGVRAKVPLTYQRFFIEHLRGVISEHFGPSAGKIRFTACHFSVVTTSPDNLAYLQRIPHIDSFAGNELAFVHYLFQSNLGGTAFYRHRKTGFEFVDQVRRADYCRIRAEEEFGPDSPPSKYINGDTPLYEQVERQEGVFNRMVLYRRNSLHSGSINPSFPLDPDPRSGRLSINGFLA
jgi:hypothetical protein